MWVVSSPYGVTLVFPNRDDLQHVVWQLQDLLSNSGESGLQPPLLYHQSEHHVPRDEVELWTDWLKYAFTEGNDVEEK